MIITNYYTITHCKELCFKYGCILAANPAFCDAMWDDVMCWQSAAPGSLVTQPCPDYIIRSVSEVI
jgi:hypothetical protein